MADYSFVPTEALRNYIAHSRRENAEWVRIRRDLEERLKSARKQAKHWAQEVAEQEAELRAREPERGGSYEHAEGFFYESFRGRDFWEYRISGTSVLVRETGVYDGYMNYDVICERHGKQGLSGTLLDLTLSRAYKHFRETH
jgi:hypothetical protein